MAERTWTPAITERMIFSEEVLTVRRLMRAVSLLAGLPIMCIIKCCSSSNSTTDSSTDTHDNARAMTTIASCKVEETYRDGAQDQNNEEMQCVICLYNVFKGEKYMVLEECCHRFHVDCIDAWLMQNSTCPLCRCSVTYIPAAKMQQQLSSASNEDNDQEAYYEVVIASILNFLDHLWKWFLNPLGFDQSCQAYHGFL